MAHFAELDDNNTVIRVLVINDDDILDEHGNESEKVGRAFCAREFGGRWVQTSYNHRIRVRYAGIGMTYDEQRDAFIWPQPAPWFVRNEQTADWECPNHLNPETGEPWTAEQMLILELGRKMDGLVMPTEPTYA